MNSSEENNEKRESSEFQENLNILREISFFSGFPLEALKVLAYLCTREKYQSGDYLFSQKDDDGQALFVISGKARLFYKGETKEGVIRDYDEGSFLGGLTLMANLRRLFSLQALTDLTCLVLTRDKFSRTMEQFPDLMPKAIKALVEGIGLWEERFLAERDSDCTPCRHKVGVSLL
jgi:CRP-like cAMP-binding protein